MERDKPDIDRTVANSEALRDREIGEAIHRHRLRVAFARLEREFPFIPAAADG